MRPTVFERRRSIMPSALSKEFAASTWSRLPHPIRWVGVAVVGSTLVLVGLLLMVLPGPGIPLLILGLVVLATEFAWAQRTVNRVKSQSSAVFSSITSRLRKEPRS
jgi:hypothetical protein